MRDMSKYGKRWICMKCDARFYDLNKAEPICPKCGHNQLLDIVGDEDFFEEEDEEVELKDVDIDGDGDSDELPKIEDVIKAVPDEPLEIEEKEAESDGEAAQEAIGDASKARKEIDASGDSDDDDDF